MDGASLASRNRAKTWSEVVICVISKTARPLAQSSAPESPGPLALSLFLKYSLHFLIFFLAPPCLSQSTTLSLSQSPRCLGMAGCERAAERGAVAHGGREHTAAAAAWGCGEKQEQVRYRPPKKRFLSTPTNIFRSNIPRTRSPSASSFSAR